MRRRQEKNQSFYIFYKGDCRVSVFTTSPEITLSKIPELRNPATASLCSATPKKNVPCFSDLRVTNFSKKGKGIFLWGSALQVFRQCSGAKCNDEAKQNYFCVGICFASALFCVGIWYPPRRMVREECAAEIWTNLELYAMVSFETLRWS